MKWFFLLSLFTFLSMDSFAGVSTTQTYTDDGGSGDTTNNPNGWIHVVVLTDTIGKIGGRHSRADYWYSPKSQIATPAQAIQTATQSAIQALPQPVQTAIPPTLGGLNGLAPAKH